MHVCGGRESRVGRAAMRWGIAARHQRGASGLASLGGVLCRFAVGHGYRSDRSPPRRRVLRRRLQGCCTTRLTSGPLHFILPGREVKSVVPRPWCRAGLTRDRSEWRGGGHGRRAWHLRRLWSKVTLDWSLEPTSLSNVVIRPAGWRARAQVMGVNRGEFETSTRGHQPNALTPREQRAKRRMASRGSSW